MGTGKDRDRTWIDGHNATLATPIPDDGGERPSAPLAYEGPRYRLGDVLGEGGMGEIVLAVDEQIGREVAVKRIRAEQPTGEQLSRFVREARVQARLQHPAIVPVHDIAVDADGKPFFVMKRLAGTEMKELLARMPDVSPEEAAAVRRRLLRAFVDVCLCVEFAHSQGIVHRDLKPANIMLGEYGEVYVLDWGIARALADTEEIVRPSSADLALETGETRVGAVLGTPAYMAPEQLVGERVGPPADIYALGCILYEIVAGEALHPSSRSIVSAILIPDARPSSKRPDAPPELDAICERAIHADPKQRFESARALGQVVQSFLDGDRDVAARRQLAADHIREARVARSLGDRKTAMREAGRALALDPTANEAAELVTGLMLEPPAEVPVEVERELASLDVSTARYQARVGAIAMTGYLWFLPILWWTGVRDWALVIAFGACAVVSAAQIYALSRRTSIPQPAIYMSAIVNALLIALVCRLVGPFVIAPTLVLTTLMAFAVHPSFGRMPVITGILTLGVAVPWLLEAAGVLAPTYRFDAGTIVLLSPAISFSAAPVQLAFALVLVLLGAITAVLLRSMAVRQREAAKQIELQAWHLRQLVTTR
jgi:eukaryotic-like serine/threonine-protein kinase